MSDSEEPVPVSRVADLRFATTRWSLVLTAGRGDLPQAEGALAQLCQDYWYPLYAYVRRQGYQAAEAQDLTQEFFARLLEGELLGRADPERGRFRSFLLTLIKRFLSEQRRRAAALKRGGGRRQLSLDFEVGERRIRCEPSCDWTAEREFDRRWALALLENVLERLQADYVRRGKAELFGRLQPFITADGGLPTHRELAAELGMTEGALKVAIHRLRTRYRDSLRAEVGQTVSDPHEVDDELRLLLEAVRGPAEHSPNQP